MSDQDEEGPVGDVGHGVRGGNVVGQRVDDGGGDHALHGGEADFFDGDGGNGQRAHDAVVDLAGDAELLGEGKCDGGDAGEHDGDGHEAGEQNGREGTAGHGGGGVHGGADAHVGDDVGEDEEEEQRVHADADDEGEELAAEDVEVAQEEAGEGAGVLYALRALRAAGDGRMRRFRIRPVESWVVSMARMSYSRRSRPVSWMKTVSRLVSVMVRSRRP